MMKMIYLLLKYINVRSTVLFCSLYAVSHVCVEQSHVKQHVDVLAFGGAQIGAAEADRRSRKGAFALAARPGAPLLSP